VASWTAAVGENQNTNVRGTRIELQIGALFWWECDQFSNLRPYCVSIGRNSWELAIAPCSFCRLLHA